MDLTRVLRFACLSKRLPYFSPELDFKRSLDFKLNYSDKNKRSRQTIIFHSGIEKISKIFIASRLDIVSHSNGIYLCELFLILVY